MYIKIESKNYKKDRIVCRDCYIIEKRKYINKTLIQKQHPRIDIVNTNKNNRTLLVGASFSSKTILIKEILSRIPGRDFYIITNATEQYPNSKIQNLGNRRRNKSSD